jgi:hypothetical protein
VLAPADIEQTIAAAASLGDLENVRELGTLVSGAR